MLLTPLQRARARNAMTLKFDYFLTWSPTVAFDVGYIRADGCIMAEQGRLRALKLGCQTRDEELILGLRDRLGSNHVVYRNPVLRCTTVSIYSRKIAETLVEHHNILPRKSFLDLPFPDVPQDFLPYFVLGYLIGDGCISRSKRGQTSVSFFGTRTFIGGLADRVAAATGLVRSRVFHVRSTTYGVQWGSRSDLNTLYHWLFPPGQYPYLPRKKQVLAEAVLR